MVYVENRFLNRILELTMLKQIKWEIEIKGYNRRNSFGLKYKIQI